MATLYKELYDSVCSKIKDYDFILMGEEEADAILKEYIRPAIVMFEAPTQDLSDRDDNEEMFCFDLTDKNFEILVNYMVVCYLDATYIRTPLALQAHMSTSDFYKFDNKDVLGKAIEIRNVYLAENDRLMRNYSYIDGRSLEELYSEKGGYSASKIPRRKRCEKSPYKRGCG